MSEIPVSALQAWLEQGNRLLLDVRDFEHQASAVAVEAQCSSPDAVQTAAKTLLSQYDAVALMCYHGIRSKQLCAELGPGFYGVVGGFAAYLEAGLPTRSVTDDSGSNLSRYEKQMKLTGFGLPAQVKLSKAAVLVVGAGGLGAPALMYLAGAGVGTLILVDPDQVALSNLHRQVLYSSDGVGQPKVELAQLCLNALNPEVQIQTHQQALNAQNAEQLIQGVNLVIDGSDNVPTRLLLNDVCNRLRKPWIYAGVSGFEWQMAFFKPGQACYRCLFPELQSDQQLPNCSDVGVLGPVPGMAAMMQVTEAIKYLADLPGVLDQQMIHHDLQRHEHKVLKYNSIPNCKHQPS